jgi:hypothetical protein
MLAKSDQSVGVQIKTLGHAARDNRIKKLRFPKK